jgi:uncharacterized protein (TIGR03437 family)
VKFALLLVPILAFGQAQNYLTYTFDPPGSTNTLVTGINNAGQIVGNYTDASKVVHGFIRAADAVTYTTIDVPAQATADGINNLGQVVGTYKDATGQHGYIRSADGRTFTTLEPGLAPKAINDKGDIVGQIVPSDFVAQSFLRTADGHVTMLPGWTYASGINNAGDVVGYTHTGTGGIDLGFVRYADGSMESIQVPGTDGQTRPSSINNHGQIAGDILDGHAFIRNADGTYATFDLLGVANSLVEIDDSGRAVAYTFDPAGNRYHGLVAVPSAAFTQPAIRKWSGVLTASGFGGATAIGPGTWIEIYGQNLASTTRAWRLSDFSGDVAPTSLEGVTVRINGRPAYISYISPTQINALVPADLVPGTATVVVNNSASYTLTANALTPGLLVSPRVLNVGVRNVQAYFPDWTPVGSDHPAKPGDTIILLGIGFGPVTPDVPVGQIARQPTRLQTDVQVTIGGVPATVTYAGLAPGSVALYQFNVVVPQGAPTGGPIVLTLEP